MATKRPLQKILKGTLPTENKNKHNHKGQKILDLKKRTDKYFKSSLE
jgi:hypothetical protein